MQKRILAVSIAAAFLAAMPARAEPDDCFPGCTEAPQAPPASPAIDLCQHAAVREVARIDRELAPVKEVAGIALDPRGFAFKMVDRYVVHIPQWVGFAMDPRGAIKAKLIHGAREALKKQAGLQHDCADVPA